MEKADKNGSLRAVQLEITLSTASSLLEYLFSLLSLSIPQNSPAKQSAAPWSTITAYALKEEMSVGAPPCAILARSRRGELSAPWPLLPTLPCFFPACVAHCSVVHSSQMSMQCCLFCISWGRGESSWDQAGLFLQLSKAWQQMTYKTAVLIRQNKNRNRNSKQTLCPFRCWEPRIHAALGRPWWVFTQQTVKIPSVGRNFFLSDHLRYTIFFRFLFFFLEKTSLFIKNFYMTASCCSCR